jgi:replicative DNA helicase
MDELRRVPQNIEAEQAVLGSMILNSACIPDVIELLGRDDFYLPVHQQFFDAIYGMFANNEVFDPVTFQGKLREMGAFDENSTAGYIDRLLDITPTSAHVKAYAEMVSQQAVLRSLDAAASEVSGLAREPGAVAEHVLEHAEKTVYEIREGKENTSLYKIPDVLLSVYRNLKELSESGGKLPGISFGHAFTELDDILGGMLKSNLIIIASRPGVGKTSIMLNMGLSAARSSGKSVVFFSLEMSKEQLVGRLLSTETGINSKKMLTGKLSSGDFQRLGEASGALMGLPFFFDEKPNISVEEMKAKCRRVKNLGLVIVDYLQLVDVPRGKGERRFENRVGEVGHISRSLKIMSKELEVPIVCAAQLRRESERGKRPMLSDLRESGSIEQDADSVLLLHREFANNPEADPNAAEVIIAKNRHGRTGIVELYWSGDVTSFTQKETRYD